jgi:hypothetical protein
MRRSRSRYLLGSLFLASLVWAPSLYADDQHDGEETITVIERGATAEDIVNIIQLPARASAAARENRRRGPATAEQARDLGHEFGQQIAEDAKTKGLAEHIRDDIQQNQRRDARGDNGQGNRPDGN